MSDPLTGGIVSSAPPIDVGAWVMRLVFLVVGLAVLTAGLNYGLETAEGLVGPGLMPFTAGLVTVLAAVWESVNAYRKQRNPGPSEEADNAIADADELEAAELTGWQRNRPVVLVFAVIVGAVLLTRVIGLLLALSLMVIVLIFAVERKPWWSALIGGTATFLFGWVVFGLVLQVPLPTGMLGLI